MLAAVTQDAPTYEGLRNYVLAGGRPTAVPAFDASARQPTGAPGGALPGAPTPIPTSSARPGKQTNQRVTYARMQTKFPSPAYGGLDPEGVHEGDVVFVHRYDGMNAGHDVNRPTCVATIAQLNIIFGNFNPSEPDRRSDDAGVLFMDAVDHVTGLPNDPQGIVAAPKLPVDATEAQMRAYNADRYLYENDYPKYRWRHCKALASWTPDGVCCATEHEHGKDTMVGKGASNPGELFNIAIGGPTLVRNAAHHKHNMHVPEQHIDDGLRVLDKVFVGLVCHEQRDEYQTLTHYAYTYKLFTARQFAWAAFQSGAGPGGMNSIGPRVADFHRMITPVWRLGSVLDAKAGMLPYKCITMNVVIEEWSVLRVSDEYNRSFGVSYYLAPLFKREMLERTKLLQAAQLLITLTLVARLRDMHVAVQEWVRVDAIDIARVIGEMRAWNAVDLNVEAELSVQTRRWETWEVDPEDPNRRLGPYGSVVRPVLEPPRVRNVEADLAVREGILHNTGTFYYEPPSGALAALFERFNLNETQDPDANRSTTAALGVTNEQRAIIGRTAALLDDTLPGDEDYDLIVRAEEAHAYYMGLRPFLTFWNTFESSSPNWPLRRERRRGRGAKQTAAPGV